MLGDALIGTENPKVMKKMNIFLRCPLAGCGRRFWVSLATGPGETMKRYYKGGYHAFVGNL